MLFSVIPGRRFCLVIDNEVDASLSPQVNILGTMTGYLGKADCLENRFQKAFFPGCKFNKFKAIQAHWVLK